MSMLLQLFLADFEQLLCAEYTITEICSKWPILKTQQYCFSFLVSDFDNNFVKRSKTPGSFWPLIFYKNWEINPSQATLFLYPWKQPKTRRFLMFSAGTERDKWHEMRQWQEFKICNSKNYKFFSPNFVVFAENYSGLDKLRANSCPYRVHKSSLTNTKKRACKF